MTCAPGTNLDSGYPVQGNATERNRRATRRVIVHNDEIRASKARVRARLLMELVRRDIESSSQSQPALTAAD